MSSSASFTTASFALQSVVTGVPGTVRVTFTADPTLSNPAGATDGLNPLNYTFSGPGIGLSVSVAVVAGDPQSVDVALSAPLAVGTWTLTVANILGTFGDSLGSPTSMSFEVSDAGDTRSINPGAVDDDTPDRVIRKHLNSALTGPNWDALIEAISTGDDYLWDVARKSFEQLFKSSAGEKYLDRLGSNDGLSRPSFGIGDEAFRKLLIKYSNEKVTHEALRGILEVFYGQDSVRAWVETDGDEDYALLDGQTLTWVIDEDYDNEFRVVFESDQFVVINQASAAEVAAILTQAMSSTGSSAFAVPVVAATTGDYRVRIYSGSTGMRSYVRVTGGTAQTALGFSERRSVYPGTVTAGDGLTWTYSTPEAGTTKISLTTTGIPDVDISQVEAGDYVVIGDDVSVVVSGSHEITEVGILWNDPNPGDYTQFFVVDEALEDSLGNVYTGAGLQVSNDSYQFFRKKRADTITGARTVTLTQFSPGSVSVKIPATTSVVDRTPLTGAYPRSSDSVDIVRWFKDVDGLMTIELTSPPDVAVGDQIRFDGMRAAPYRPWISPATGGGSDASHGSGFCGVVGSAEFGSEMSVGTLMLNGDILWTGGRTRAATVLGNAETYVNKLTLSGTTAVADGTEADTALRQAFAWTAVAQMGTARYLHQATALSSGDVLVTGGTSDDGTTFLKSAEVYSSGGDTWTATPDMAQFRQNHRQVLLPNGLVLVTGGETAAATPTATCELYNEVTDTWATTAPMSEARSHHFIALLSDGTVMVTGGKTTGGVAINTSEIYTPGAGTWATAPRRRWSEYNGLTFTHNGSMWVFGGDEYGDKLERYDENVGRWVSKYDSAAGTYNYPEICGALIPGTDIFWVSGDSSLSAEQYDISTGKWTKTLFGNPARRDCVVATEQDGVLAAAGGHDGTDSYTEYDLWVRASDSISGDSINGVFEVTAVSGNTFTVDTKMEGYASNFSLPYDASVSYDAASGTYLVSSGLMATGADRDANDLVTLSFAALTGVSGGDTIFVNSDSANFPSGLKTVISITGTALTYEEAGSTVTETPYMSVSVRYKNTDAYTPLAAVSATTDAPGPYLFDPIFGVAVTAAETTLTTAVRIGQAINSLSVVSTEGFEDGVGYFVLGFGGAKQSQPMRYLETLSGTTILVDFEGISPYDYPVGTTVTYVLSQSAWVPDNPADVGSFYITGTQAARLQAQALLEAASGAGVTLDFDVTYPGDRGLGAEGGASESPGKLSDIAWVFGGDDFEGS